MDYESIFNFLNDDKKFNQIYQECLAFENTILNNLYTSSLRNGRVISELLIKKIAHKSSKLRKKFFKVKDGKKPKTELYKIIKGCYFEKLIDEDTKEKYFTVKEYGDANAHGENFYEYDLLDCKKVHKLLFELSLDCFKMFHDDDLKFDYLNDLSYNYNLNSQKPSKFTAEERIELIDKIYADEINKKNFINYLNLNKIYLDISLFKEIICNNFIEYLKNIDEYEKFIDSNQFIDENDVSEVLSYFDSSMKHDIYDMIKEENKNILSYIFPYLDDFPQNFTIEYISDIIEKSNEHEKENYKLIRELSFNFLNDDLKVLTKELENESVIEKDEYGREIEKFKNYKIVKEDYGLKIEQVEKNILFDKDQKYAVNYDGDKPLVINAGPGSGKTRVIIERVKFLVDNGAEPSSILVITFTNEATNELRNRLKYETDLSDQIVNQIKISTIHGFCRYIIANFDNIPYNYLERHGERSLFINKHKEELGFTDFSQVHDSDVSIITKLYDNYFNFGLVSEDFSNYLRRQNSTKITYRYRDFVKDFENEYGIFPTFNQIQDAGYRNAHYHAKWIAIVESYPKYNTLLEKHKSCDDNSLLEKAYNLLCYIKIPFKNILIDEFQDTNHAFMIIFKKLLENSDSFTIVGDSDQSIYGWRGALPRYFDQFTSKENRDKVEYVELHTNYRSTADIVEFSEEFIKDKRLIPKNLWAKKQYKAPVYFLNNQRGDEFNNIIHIIKSLYDDKIIKKYSDIAVLFRTNEEAMDFSLRLKNNNVPFYLKGNKDLLEQDEIKSLLILFWYLMPYEKTKLYYRSDDFLNFYGLASDYADKFFNLSDETKGVLKKIQSEYEEKITRIANMPYKKLFNKEFDFIDKVVSEVDSIDLANLDDFGFIKLGISNERDINFFLKLKNIKSRMFEENQDKPTTLQIFNELIHLNDYVDKIHIDDSLKALKIEKNLATVSRIIKDYENIMGLYDYIGLFEYLDSVLGSYSSYIDESETFDDEVHVMTIHKSKGLEYPIVIIASLEDGTFPKEYKIPLWHTNVEFLKYKPDDVSEEITQYNLEQMRLIYVAATRAKEILILSSVHYKPEVFVRLKNNSNLKFKNLNKSNVHIIPKIESSNSISSKTYIQELSFEAILRDYSICPFKYYLSNDSKFAVEISDDDYVEMVLHRVLGGIHSQKNLSKYDIKLKIDTMLKFHNIGLFEKDNEIISNIFEYWNNYGKYYNVYKTNFTVLKHLNSCDLYGTIDLIVEDESEGYSIVQFIGSDEQILNIDYYVMLMHFYSSALKENDEFKEKQLNYIILHSLDKNSVKKFKIEEMYEKFGLKKLDNISSKILEKKFEKKNNCEICGYNKFCNG